MVLDGNRYITEGAIENHHYNLYVSIPSINRQIINYL